MTAHAAVLPGLLTTDRFLIGLYLVGIYLGIAIRLPGGIPLPAVIAGVAGLALLAKHARRISVSDAACLAAMLATAFASIALAPDASLVGERFKGVIQFGYSIAIAYGFYLAARELPAAWLSRFALAMSLAILAIGALENALPAFRELVNQFRATVFASGVYSADIRDLALYGHIRPKVLTSEPSFASFGLVLFAFIRYVLSGARLKIVEFVCLLGLGYLVLRGPTILLGFALVPVYEGLLAARTGPPGARHLDTSRVFMAFLLTGIFAVLAAFTASLLFEDRVENIVSGRDASIFARLIAPPIVAFGIISEHPVTGVGLAGWEYLENTVQQLYATTDWLQIDFNFESAAHGLTNWFWLHWIFLGLLFGSVMVLVLTLLLHSMGVPSVLFCWAVWAIFGQAAGSYVGPRTWTIFVIAAVVSLIHEREHAARQAVAGAMAPEPISPLLVAGHRMER